MYPHLPETKHSLIQKQWKQCHIPVPVAAWDQSLVEKGIWIFSIFFWISFFVCVCV